MKNKFQPIIFSLLIILGILIGKNLNNNKNIEIDPLKKPEEGDEWQPVANGLMVASNGQIGTLRYHKMKYAIKMGREERKEVRRLKLIEKERYRI